MGTDTGADLIVGRNPVLEALRAGRPVERLFIAKGASGGVIDKIVHIARRENISVRFDGRRRLDRLADGLVHQGVVAVAAPVPYVDVAHLLARGKDRGEDPLLTVLDEVQDPHNVGSLLRSADGAGAHGIIVPKRRSAGLTTTVARTSAGAVEHVPVAQVPNIVQALTDLKKRGIWVVGADMGAEQTVWDADLSGPVAVVIGGEDKGIGRLVRETCDFLVRIPMYGQINSLNASVAGALLLFEISRQRRQKPIATGNG